MSLEQTRDGKGHTGDSNITAVLGRSMAGRGVTEAQQTMQTNPRFGMAAIKTGGVERDQLVITPIAGLQAASPDNTAFSDVKAAAAVKQPPAGDTTALAAAQPHKDAITTKAQDHAMAQLTTAADTGVGINHQTKNPHVAETTPADRNKA